MVKVSTLLVASLAGEASRVALASSHADSPVGWSKLSRMAARAVDKTSGLIPGRSGGKTKDSEKGALLKSLQDLAVMVAVNHLRAALKGSGSSSEFKETTTHGGAGGVRLSDVLGCDEAKGELEQVLDFVAHPDKFTALGATIPKGILLVGPPGCGKTLIAKAVAGEAGVPFISLSGSDFKGEYAGVGTAKVKRLFAAARKHEKCIIFIDEIDTLGRRRSGGDSALAMDSESTLNQLLVEMDGFDQKSTSKPARRSFSTWLGKSGSSGSGRGSGGRGGSGILVLAGTNRRDMLDPALLRAGRFDRVVNIDPPDVHGRAQLFDRYMQTLPLAKFDDNKSNGEHDGTGQWSASGDSTTGSTAAANATEAANQNRARFATAVAQMTPGFTGAQAATLCNEAALRAALDTSHGEMSPTASGSQQPQEDLAPNVQVTLQHFSDALDRMVGGLERPGHFVPRPELHRTSVHEAGHVLVAWHSTHAAAPIKVSVVSRGHTNGFAQTQDLEKSHQGEAELLDRLAVLLAGRVAEELVLGDPSTGASNDLERATELAYEMVSKLGYSKKVGLLSVGFDQRRGSQSMRAQVSDATAQLVDSEVRALMGRAYNTCRRLLQQHQPILEAFANALLAKEVLLADDIQRLLGDRPLAAQQIAALYDRATATTTTNSSPEEGSSATTGGSALVAASAATPRYNKNDNKKTTMHYQRGRPASRSIRGNNAFSSGSRNMSPQPELPAAVQAVNAALLMEEQGKGSSSCNRASINTQHSSSSSSALRQSSQSESITVAKSETPRHASSTAVVSSPLTWAANCGRALQPIVERFGGMGAAMAVAAACHYLRGVV